MMNCDRLNRRKSIGGTASSHIKETFTFVIIVLLFIRCNRSKHIHEKAGFLGNRPSLNHFYNPSDAH